MLDRLVTRYLRAPEHAAKLRIVRALARTVIPRQGIIADVEPNLRLYLHPTDWIEYRLLSGLPYEPLTLGFIERNLVAGQTAVLAGVNFGMHVAVAARAVGAQGVVLGVEPQPAAILRAKLNLDLNGLDGPVTLVQGAFGATEGLVPMAWSDVSNAGAASLFDTGPTFLVQILTLDRLLAYANVSAARLVLLDVQGYEFEALAGLDARNSPELAVVELDPDFLERAGVTADSIANRLVDLGYQLFDLQAKTPHDLLDLPERNIIGVKASANVNWDFR